MGTQMIVFDIGDTVPNPLLSSEPSDMEKPFSNKVMAFAVDFGIPIKIYLKTYN